VTDGQNGLTLTKAGLIQFQIEGPLLKGLRHEYGCVSASLWYSKNIELLAKVISSVIPAKAGI